LKFETPYDLDPDIQPSPRAPRPALTPADGATFALRPARPEDIGVIHAMIGELADYEKLAHLFVASEADVHAALFGPNPRAEVLLAWFGGEPAAFALYFHNFSTFLGRPGLWLEDLFVRPAYRRRGCANALLKALAGIARERGCGRFEWAVLDWNVSAIDFYRSLGATVLPDWRIVRVVGPSLDALAGPRPKGG
jgi:GNAT superfamily N-acetyltransferase